MAYDKDAMGIIFDIKEFSVNDGPGVRQTVFFKGCPLRCSWCHNPEGLKQKPQLTVRYGDCLNCGKCTALCENERCVACGKCVKECPLRLRDICGYEISAAGLAEILLENADIYEMMGGGVTFSGGEPLKQSDFLLDVCGRLPGMNKAVETSGYSSSEIFSDMIASVDLIMLDLKLTDPNLHQKYCGVDNALILENLKILKSGNTPFIIRVPLIPGVTDSEANITAIAALLIDAKALLYVEFLPYNRLAGAKYGKLGMEYKPGFDTERPLMGVSGAFEKYGIESKIL